MTDRAADIAKDLIGDCILVPSPVGESGCKVWRMDRTDGLPSTYLKHGKGAVADLVTDEMIRLRWLARRLPVPRIIRFVASTEECWLMTEVVVGRTARSLLDERCDQHDSIIDALADFLRQIHDLPADACPFDARLERRLPAARARIDAGLVNAQDFGSDYQGWSPEQVWNAIHAQMPLVDDFVFTHGDYSLDNVLLDGPRITGCIDVGGAGLADRYHDLAICWSDLAEYGPRAQQRFLARYGEGRGDRRKLIAYQLLNELF